MTQGYLNPRFRGYGVPQELEAPAPKVIPITELPKTLPNDVNEWLIKSVPELKTFSPVSESSPTPVVDAKNLQESLTTLVQKEWNFG